MQFGDVFLDQLSSIQNKREKLCLLVNSQKPLSTSIQTNEITWINIGQLLSEKLIILPKSDRSIQTLLIFSEIVNAAHSKTIGLNQLEILFSRELAVDPLKLLRENAKDKSIVACWPGHHDANIGLSYAQPSHPEYRFYKTSDVGDLLIVDIEAQEV